MLTAEEARKLLNSKENLGLEKEMETINLQIAKAITNNQSSFTSNLLSKAAITKLKELDYTVTANMQYNQREEWQNGWIISW